MTVPILAATGSICVETPFDDAAVRVVVAGAFGPGHLARTAERLREGATPVIGFTARLDDRLVGSVRLWPIHVGEIPALFLGPIAVERSERNAGLGADLVEACVEWGQAQGWPGILLVGDPPYFQRFGFEPAPDVVLPGPVDQRRVLWRGRDSGAAAPSGQVRAG